jgi:hypothetical protein
MSLAIISCSLPSEQLHFCKNTGLSPSFLLQSAILEKMQLNSGEILDSNASLQAKINRLSEHIAKMMEFINKKGLQDDFLVAK